MQVAEAMISVPRSQIEALYQLLGSLLNIPDNPNPSPIQHSPSPTSPPHDEEGLRQAVVDLMQTLELANPRLPSPHQWEGFLRETNGDYDVIAAVLEYVKEQERRGQRITSPIAYGLSVLRRDPMRFRKDTAPPTAPTRPSLDAVRRVIEGNDPL